MNPASRPSLIILFTLALILFACYPDDEDLIPAYIHIEHLGLVVSGDQGTASHKITDAWVTINGKLIGVYELPATFPVLKTGLHEVKIEAGIKLNGISATRSAYPFFEPIITTLNLEPGNTTIVTDTLTTYKNNIKFAWMEDFNGNVLSVDTTGNSQTGFQKVSDTDLVFRHGDEINPFSAMARLEGDTTFFEIATKNSFDLPKGGVPVFLEMNYKNDHIATIGFYLTLSGQVVQHPVLVLNPSEKWNKIYINLTPTIANFHTATDFKIFAGILKNPDTGSATFYFDHFKLIY